MARDKSIDALRGLAITLVVAGHAIVFANAVSHGGPGLVYLGDNNWVPLATATNLFLSFVYSFHMPLFAFVSGIVLWPPRTDSLGSQIMRRARSLLVPYMAWSVIFYAITRRAIPLPSAGLKTALMDAAVGRGGLWYLYALFVCSTVILCLTRVRGARWSLLATVFAAVVCSSGRVFALPDVLYLKNVLWIYPFVVLGYMMGPMRSKVLEHRLLTVAAGILAFVPLFYLVHPVHVWRIQPVSRLAVKMFDAGIRGGFVLTVLLPYVCAAAAVLALYGLYLGRAGRAIRAQAWLGRKSLGIYAIHGPVFWLLAAFGVKSAPVLFVVGLGASTLTTVVLERIPFLDYVLLGQRTAGRPWRADGAPPGQKPPPGPDDPGVI